ncbi:MAG: hypothetical protein WD894_22135 [Pirellulales bacterium]
MTPVSAGDPRTRFEECYIVCLRQPLGERDGIYQATNEEGTAATGAPFTSYGTRHRSAFRFVEGMDLAVAFIRSQDGGIKAVTLVENRVVIWSYFEVGYTTALS